VPDHHRAGLVDYLWLAWLVSTLATIDGGLPAAATATRRRAALTRGSPAD